MEIVQQIVRFLMPNPAEARSLRMRRRKRHAYSPVYTMWVGRSR